MTNKLSPTRARILNLARDWLRTPYCHQASVKGVGCDCFGLFRGLWNELYGTEIDISIEYDERWYVTATSELLLDFMRAQMTQVDISTATPGDLIVFRLNPQYAASHCGIASTDNALIHAILGKSVVETPFSNYWTRRVAGAFAFTAL